MTERLTGRPSRSARTERSVNVVAGAAGLSALAWVGVARIPIDPTVVSPELHASDWIASAAVEPLTAAALGVAGGILGALLPVGSVGSERRRRSAIALPLLIPAFAWAFGIPGLASRLRILSALHGRFLGWIAVLVTLAILWEWVHRHGGAGWARRLSPMVLTRAVTALGFTLFLIIGLSNQQRVGFSGDEPHYLLISQSLLLDGDLKVQNNYAERDFESFYGGKIGAHLAEGSEYSVHGIGLPLLLTPALGLGGLTGVAVLMAALGALLVREIYLACLELTGQATTAFLCVGTFALSLQGLFQTTAIYPELLAGIAIAFTLRRLGPSATLHPGGSFALGVGIGLLPLAHVKFIPLAGLLSAGLALRHRGAAPRVLGGAILGLTAVVGTSLMTSGSLDPTAGYGRRRIFWSAVPEGAAGLWLDQEFGLLALSPFFVLGLVGLFVLRKQAALLSAVACLVVVGMTLVGASHPLWTGGSSPPARFLYPVLPALVIGAATLWTAAWRPRVRGLLRTLVLVTVGFGVAAVLLPAQPLYLNSLDGSARVLEALSPSHDLSAYFPSIVRGDSRLALLALIVGAVVVSVMVARIDSRRPRRRLRRGVRLAAIGLLLWLQPERRAPLPASSRAIASEWLGALAREPDGEIALWDSRRRLRAKELAAGMRLEVGTLTRMRPLSLPAGRYRFVTGTRAEPIRELCNGEACWGMSAPSLESRVDLVQFHPSDEAPVVIIIDELAPPGPYPPLRALRSLWLQGQDETLRIHGLDDAAYLDPRGFWTRGDREASFALESGREVVRLRVVNGPRANLVEYRVDTTPDRADISGSVESNRFRLRPGESRELAVSVPEGLTQMTLRSRESFRPSEMEPETQDDRVLGVFLTGFDLSR